MAGFKISAPRAYFIAVLETFSFLYYETTTLSVDSLRSFERWICILSTARILHYK